MSTFREEYWKLDVESDLGNAKSYDWLRDVALLCFNPPDGEESEESIVSEAMLDAAEFIEAQPCECVNTDPSGDHSVPYGVEDQCRRCAVLGRYFDERSDR